MSRPVTVPHEVDKLVGVNIRRMRKARGMSQESLAEALGITFQQVQKYERGANRVSASRLHMCALALGCTYADLLPPLDAPARPMAATWLDRARQLEFTRPGMIDRLLRAEEATGALSAIDRVTTICGGGTAGLAFTGELAAQARSCIPEGMVAS